MPDHAVGLHLSRSPAIFGPIRLPRERRRTLAFVARRLARFGLSKRRIDILRFGIGGFAARLHRGRGHDVPHPRWTPGTGSNRSESGIVVIGIRHGIPNRAPEAEPLDSPWGSASRRIRLSRMPSHLEENPLWILDALLDPHEERHGLAPVDDAMIVGERDVHHGTQDDLAIDAHRALLDRVHPQDS